MMIESYVSLQEYNEIIKIMRFENKMSWNLDWFVLSLFSLITCLINQLSRFISDYLPESRQCNSFSDLNSVG